MFSGLLDNIRIRIRILLSSSKNCENNIESYCFVTSYDFLSFKNDVNVLSKRNKKKNLEKKLVDVFKITDENSRIQILIRIHWSEVWIRGSGSGKFHRTATLPETMNTSTVLQQRSYLYYAYNWLIDSWRYKQQKVFRVPTNTVQY